MKTLSLLLLITISVSGIAQDTLGTEVIYHSGDQVRESQSNIEITIPRGWVGVNPENEEAFLLLPENHTNAQIMVMIYEYSHRDSLRNQLKKGLVLANDIKVKPTGSLGERNNWIAADLDVGKNGAEISGYAEGKCENGHCAIHVLIADRKDLDALKNSVYRLSDKTVFDGGMGMR